MATTFQPRFKLSDKKWRVQSLRDLSRASVDSSVELNGSSSMSLGKVQRKSIESSINISPRENDLMSYKAGDSINRNGKLFFRRFNSEDQTEKEMTSSRSSSIDVLSLGSSIQAEEEKDNSEEVDDFVIPIELLKNRRTKSKKKKTKMDNFRSFLRKSLKLPLDKKHQQWSRYSFDASSLSFGRPRSGFF